MKIITAFDYLKFERKITAETIRKFHLAWCDSNGEIYIDSDFQGQLPSLDKRFYNSTLFPLFSLHNDIIGVSCRPLAHSAQKYLNTSYNKAQNLYSLNITWQECLKEQSVYVVEGNFSLLVPWQNGVKNIVAMLGSNLSLTQIALLNRFVKKVIFVSDKDKAGERFIEKMRVSTKQKFYDSDIEFYFKDLPQGSDPDDYFTKLGGTLESFKALPEKELNYGR